MDTREHCHMLLDRLGEAKLCAVATFLEKLDEELDMEFCLALAREAEDDPDKETVSFDECLAELGLTYADLHS